jgi:hypothetical protein
MPDYYLIAKSLVLTAAVTYLLYLTAKRIRARKHTR